MGAFRKFYLCEIENEKILHNVFRLEHRHRYWAEWLTYLNSSDQKMYREAFSKYIDPFYKDEYENRAKLPISYRTFIRMIDGEATPQGCDYWYNLYLFPWENKLGIKNTFLYRSVQLLLSKENSCDPSEVEILCETRCKSDTPDNIFRSYMDRNLLGENYDWEIFKMYRKTKRSYKYRYKIMFENLNLIIYRIEKKNEN